MRSLILALLAGLALPIEPVRAQEPLFLRIRPPDAAPPAGVGSEPVVPDDEIARRARAAREAVWERSTRRAQIAIASVCTGCLKPAPSGPVSIESKPAGERRAAEPAAASPDEPSESRLFADSSARDLPRQTGDP